MVARLYEYTKKYGIVYFKMVNCVVCELCQKSGGESNTSSKLYLKRAWARGEILVKHVLDKRQTGKYEEFYV